jgi:hypothetical protein
LRTEVADLRKKDGERETLKSALDRETKRAETAIRERETQQHELAALRASREVASLGDEIALRATGPSRAGTAWPDLQLFAMTVEDVPAAVPPATVKPGATVGTTAALAPPDPPALSAEDQRLLDRAEALLRDRDVSGARLLIARAAEAKSSRALRLLAQTYDPIMLARWRIVGLAGDEAKARDLYAEAAAAAARETGTARR